MKFSVFTASTPEWTPQEAATQLTAQGWHGIEWRVTDQAEAPEPGFWAGNKATWPMTGIEDSVPEIARITSEAGLEFSGLGGYARCDNHDGVERVLAATAALGARQVRVNVLPLGNSTMGGLEPSGLSYPELFAATRGHYEWVAERAAHHGVKALVELHHGTVTASASSARRLLEGLDPQHVGVIHDLGNLLIEGWESPLPALELLGPYLAHVHVKNARWVRTENRDEAGASVWVNEWAPLAEGQGSVLEYFKALASVGYDHWVTVEDFSTEVPLAERTAGNLDFLRRAADAAGLTISGTRAAGSLSKG
ncbi:sugar phosphate isomerase/epimerase [Paenarthrobacter ureafaciens]|uniref:Sugar phosphate isomerase/epimerase n=1 Tax=Paenarthrobacter ureafaciens TaxID=37931 RepID=A0AAX3EK30_PAEUR|nr:MULTISPECIES: sugar phosphate isomerase/epimerase family protein [Paenarthrobacter]NKR11925.1 xylose isomerase [Arthrobacter sp. M5]NKR15511.1 xylose isomerase [Arthrobacter sp. M6]OEH58505.1 xylose isomerase [Arthrobacter sp. D4]OEH64792.1 xylose isomerase [Arthrobacter sp. D2]MDO5863158.1 sugar phosphate isomerase/epimerase [Paenarthrobacter sp. SD-2]